MKIKSSPIVLNAKTEIKINRRKIQKLERENNNLWSVLVKLQEEIKILRECIKK